MVAVARQGLERFMFLLGPTKSRPWCLLLATTPHADRVIIIIVIAIVINFVITLIIVIVMIIFDQEKYDLNVPREI